MGNCIDEKRKNEDWKPMGETYNLILYFSLCLEIIFDDVAMCKVTNLHLEKNLFYAPMFAA